ncbi:MAG TPA: hypothetical protein VFP90_14610 [Gemmatimonadaceae bacterium]|nr:hypothetical protein [Gemmatimonadaceae bacterium]
MSDSSRENVPRGDHVPGGPNDASAAEPNQKGKAPPGVDSAPHRSHGPHGEGEHEEHRDPDSPEPSESDGTGRGGTNPRAGGSVFDKR